MRVAHKYDDDFGHSGMSNSERSIPFLARAAASPARRAARDASARGRVAGARIATRARVARADSRASLLFAAAAAVPFLA